MKTGGTVFCLLWLPSLLFAAPVNVRVNLEKAVYHLHADKTYQTVITEDETLLTQRGIKDEQKASQTYFPKTQSLKLLKAYVIQPGGKKIAVTKKNIFTRPSPATESAPGFTNSLTTTVVFPQLIPGSKTFVRWELKQIKPDPFGINIVMSPDFRPEVMKQMIEIHAPTSLKLRWAKFGNFKVTEKKDDKNKVITAELQNKPADEKENQMVSRIDVSSVFALSSLKSWYDIGKIYWQESRDRVVVSPRVKQLAKEIVGRKRGLKAAQALYNWVAQNIHYVAVYLNQAAGYVPHSVDEILQNGYGDCKDHVAILEALLKARHINSEPVLISAGKHYRTLPVPTVYEFNHVIIYLPKYRVFADPTSRYSSFGSIGLGEAGKFVVIASTHPRPTYLAPSSSKENRYSLDNQIKILSDGSMKGSNTLRFYGYFNTVIRQIVSMGASTMRIANQLLSQTPEGGAGDISVTNPNDLDHLMVADGKWNSPYAVTLEKQAFFSVPIGIDVFYPHSLRQFITSGVRKYSIIVGAATYQWHYIVSLPEQYKLTRLPIKINFKNSAGKYSSRYKIQKNKIDVTRKLVFNQDVYSVNQYPALVDLLYKPINDARAIAVLNKKEAVVPVK